MGIYTHKYIDKSKYTQINTQINSVFNFLETENSSKE